MTIEKYHKWRDQEGEPFIPVSLEGMDLLKDRILSKGTAFNDRERKEFRLEGLLPPRVSSLPEQLERVYEGFTGTESDIDKYVYLRALQDRKEILFYALVNHHIEEMIPIIYTPTVGKACQQFSHRFQSTRGLYITPDNVDSMGEMIHHFPSRDIKIIVVTDNQGILGIGDQGVGGMGIPIGKLSLYVLGAGVHPASCLPITLDIGTDNESLLNDPLYLGVPRKRITGRDYDLFIEKFIYQIKNCFPGTVLQWEDFSKENAFRNLALYKSELPSFNDDIQGTGAVVLAGILGAMKIKKESLKDQSFAVYGAGAGGVGIAGQIHAALTTEGLDSKGAYERIFLLDSRGLVLKGRPGPEEYKAPFARDPSLVTDWKKVADNPLMELLTNQRITVLAGASKQTGAFSRQVVKRMLHYTERPAIFPLSNPTIKSEALPEDLIKWSQGKVIVATGSPFAPVVFEGKSHRIGQGNNVFIFPGVGLASIVGAFPTIPPKMFTTAAYALADCVSAEDLAQGAVYPPIGELQKVSVAVAKKVLEKAAGEGLTAKETGDREEQIRATMWKPEYLPYRRV